VIQLQGTTIDEKTSPRDLERIRRELVDAVRELQRLPLAVATPIIGIKLEDGKETAIPHRLGRPAIVFLAPPQAATPTGRIIELRSGGPDRNKYFVLQAIGWGATITVDALVL
jgi:hypothetical protein